MILYTMMPREMIFPDEQFQATSQMMINYNGVPVLAEQDEEMNYRVVRVMSTDPAHYLNNECTPGAKISFF